MSNVLIHCGAANGFQEATQNGEFPDARWSSWFTVYAAVHENLRGVIGHPSGCLNQEFGGDRGNERIIDSPRENSAGEVVDDGVEISSASVEQSHPRHVHMPDLIRA